MQELIGVINVALLSVIRRWHHRDGRSIRDIAKSTGLSRNTVKKYLANDEVEPKYSRNKVPNNLDEYSETLNSWLHRESNRSRKQRRSVKQLFYNLTISGTGTLHNYQNQYVIRSQGQALRSNDS